MDPILSNRLTRIEERQVATQEAILKLSKDVWTYDDLASFTGYSKSYLQTLVSQGELPYYKPTRKKVFFKRSEIEDWLLQNRVCSNQELEEKAING